MKHFLLKYETERSHKKHLAILGTRGIPARHGGFETFAEHLASYLISRNWDVTVYCQIASQSNQVIVDYWNGIQRICFPIDPSNKFGTILFDWKSTIHVVKNPKRPLILTLGYNTALFCLLYRFAGFRNVINMDGLEWIRKKWKLHERTWLWLNERIACMLGNELIADHPEIKTHLAKRISSDKITMIPYGAPYVTSAESTPLSTMDLEPDKYVLVIARPEPENSLLEIVRAFSRKIRGLKLVVLGNYQQHINPYHRAVVKESGPEVIMPGALYDSAIVESLRFHCLLYVHGHQVGGTNPSLVEALGCGSAILAHNNRFNQWVAGESAAFFSDEDECAQQLERLLLDFKTIKKMRQASRERFSQCFQLDDVLKKYEMFLEANL